MLVPDTRRKPRDVPAALACSEINRSAFAALVVAADAALATQRPTLELARLAGAASGSAARSLYAGIVELTAGDAQIDLHQLASPADWPLEVVVAVTAAGAKPLSSGDAMIRSAETSPFYRRWVEEQPNDLAVARSAVAERDFAALAAAAEHNCLKMHSVMWTSRPPVVYWNHVTLACMQRIRDLRDQGLGVFFTIDAGPQVKAVCLADDADAVAGSLAGVDGVIDIMRSGLGEGARVTSAE